MLFFDTETYSELDIFRVGGDKYTRNCEVMLAGYAFGDEPAKVVDLTNDESLEEVLNYLKDDYSYIYLCTFICYCIVITSVHLMLIKIYGR